MAGVELLWHHRRASCPLQDLVAGAAIYVIYFNPLKRLHTSSRAEATIRSLCRRVFICTRRALCSGNHVMFV